MKHFFVGLIVLPLLPVVVFIIVTKLLGLVTLYLLDSIKYRLQ